MNPLADGVSELLITAFSAVLLDERGPGCAVSDPFHELTKASALVIGKRVPGMPEVMKVEAGQTRRLHCCVPLTRKVTAPELSTLRAGEDESARTRTGKGVEMLDYIFDKEVRDGEDTVARL